MELTLTQLSQQNYGDFEQLQVQYDKYTERQIGKSNTKTIGYLLKNNKDEVIAGVKGNVSDYGWLWIELLFVSPELHGQGLGTQLIRLIEDEARAFGCHHVYLNSFSFQAVSFYQRSGYQVYGELPDFPYGHSVIALTKAL